MDLQATSGHHPRGVRPQRRRQGRNGPPRDRCLHVKKQDVGLRNVLICIKEEDGEAKEKEAIQKEIHREVGA